MATRLYPLSGNDSTYDIGLFFSRGTNSANLRGTNTGWRVWPLAPSSLRPTPPDATPPFDQASTVAGPTAGVELGSTPSEWISHPLDQAVTISGTITVNLWAVESSMNANVAINVVIERLDETGAIISTIAQSARTTELGNTDPPASAQNFTVTPTSTNMEKGDRIRLRIYGDDAGTMGSGFTFKCYIHGTTAAANGDSYIEFTETFGFMTVSDYDTATAQTFPGTVNSTNTLGGGTQTWTGTGNLAADDGSVASVVYTASQLAYELLPQNFGFSLPADAVIVGIEFEVQYTATGPGAQATMRLTKNGTGAVITGAAGGLRRATTTGFGAGTYTYGGPRDLWDMAWSPADIESSTFGCILENSSSGAGTTSIDYIRCRIYYWTGGTQLFLTDTAGPAVGANSEKEMWTSRGAGATTSTTNTAAGFASPIQITATAGGTALEWYSKQVEAFTLSGIALVNIRALCSNFTTASLRAELAVCDNDGTNVTVWSSNGLNDRDDTNQGLLNDFFTVTNDNYLILLSGPDISVAQGQRLRLRIFLDDGPGNAMVTGRTMDVVYAGTTEGGSGDSYLALAQAVTEFVAGTAIPPDLLTARHTPRRRLHQRI